MNNYPHYYNFLSETLTCFFHGDPTNTIFFADGDHLLFRSAHAIELELKSNTNMQKILSEGFNHRWFSHSHVKGHIY